MQTASRLMLLLMAATLGLACSDDESTVGATSDLRAPQPLAIACDDAKGDLFTLPANLPAFDPSHRGDVIRCAYEEYVAAVDANNSLQALGYTGPAVTHGMDVYRIVFRTERSAPASATEDGGASEPEGFSSAQIFLPDEQRSEAFVVTAHGTLGEASNCADSLKDITDPSYVQSSKILDLALAGNGWTVIEPDDAGFGFGQAPPGWFLAEDEAHSILDATRAMKKVLEPSATPPGVFFVGHSQGAHAVLSAQAFAKPYGMEGELLGVVPMALLWFSGLTWGASLSPLAGLDTNTGAGAVSYGMFYFYGHGELYDGAGGGLTMFQPAKRAMVQSILQSTCEDAVGTALPPLGKTPSDFYDPDFINAMQSCTILGQNCDQEPAATWRSRALADRPTIDPNSAPIVVWHGAMDTDISPARAQCGFDRIQSDLQAATNPTTTLTICGDANADHSGVAQRDIDWVAQWIDARATGKPDPPGCPGPGPLQPPGGTLTCATPPDND